MAILTSDKRGYIAGKFALELDGVNAGWLFNAEGGQAGADVVTEKLGTDHIAKKHISGVKYDDITLVFGTGMSKAVYSWMNDSFLHQYSRKNGAYIGADYNYKEYTRLTWYNALITEMGFPALDAASKDAAKFTLKITPEYTRFQTTSGGGAPIVGKYAIDPKVQKKWLPANFRLRIDGLEDACSRVTKIEALTIKQKNVQNAVGELRDFEAEPAYLEIPNLVITTSESHADALYQYHKSFVIDGKNGDDMEKGGTLEYLTPDLKEVLFTVTFEHLGIFKLTPDKVESGSEGIRRVKAEFYCENMKFNYMSFWA